MNNENGNYNSDYWSTSTIDVELDYGGDLNSAIANANEGDTIQLSDRTYYTKAIYIDKNITLAGVGNTTIDGLGDPEAAIIVGPNADNSTIRDLRITNANNGIVGDGAANLTLKNLRIDNIGIAEPRREGNNNIGISLSDVDGLQLSDSSLNNIGRKGVGVNDTVEANISGLTISDINLNAEHAQSHDAAGIKLFNTHEVTVQNNSLDNINATLIWNDTTNATSILNNTLSGVGENFMPPEFNQFVDVHGIYNEKSSNSFVDGNQGTAREGFDLYNSTEFTTSTASLGNNDFGEAVSIGTADYWTNREAEIAIATTVDPELANFDLFADEYYRTAII